MPVPLAPVALQSITVRVVRFRWRDDASKDPRTARCIVEIDNLSGDGRDNASLCGELGEMRPGLAYDVVGRWEENRGYLNFEVSSYKLADPINQEDLEHYLDQHGRWVGPVIARRMWAAFGDAVLDIAKSDPQRVAAEVSGITMERALELQSSLLACAATEQITIRVSHLLGGVVSCGVIAKLVETYGEATVRVLKKNPYLLIDAAGLKFNVADAIYLKIGGKADHLRRHVAGLVHILYERHYAYGDTSVSVDDVENELRKLLGAIHPWTLYAARLVGEIYVGRWSSQREEEISLRAFPRAEAFIATKLGSIASIAVQPNDWRNHINTDGLKADQIQALELFKRHRIMILGGPPGTGKTFLAARIIDAAKKAGVSCGVCSPTGKAAKQLTNALSMRGCLVAAQTMHSMLGVASVFSDGARMGFCFKHHAAALLPYEFIVPDEFSMVDVLLGRSFLEAVGEDTSMLIVGDRHQLPSVGPGSVLRDLIDGGVPFFELYEIRRNAGLIVQACIDIKDGIVPCPAVALDLEKGQNWLHIDTDQIESIPDIIASLHKTPPAALQPITPFRDMQAVAPWNVDGRVNVANLNARIRSVFNNTVPSRGLTFSKGDRVVRLRNGFVDKHASPPADAYPGESMVPVVNGDLGVVEDITYAKSVVVRFDNPTRIARLPGRGHQLQLAYALTCHKMQGSEVPVVIIPLCPEYGRGGRVFTREWIYTAFSRAQRALITVGRLETLRSGIAKRGNMLRRTKLRDFLEVRHEEETAGQCGEVV